MKKIAIKKIIFFHMLNDYSGSPHVLALIIKGLLKKGFLIELYTSSSETGFLSKIEGIKYNKVYYKFSSNKVVTLLLFIIAQIRYFLAVLKYKNETQTLIYINTILPFGAALGAAMVNKKIIYHVHEKPVGNSFIQDIGVSLFKRFSDKSIFVSKYLFDSFDLVIEKKRLVYNALSPDFISGNKDSGINYNVLMICSLRVFKGVLIFVELAKLLPQYSFTLVLNANNQEISSFFQKVDLPTNLSIFSTQNKLTPFYEQANLVLNLSIPTMCIETFGLTILEALSYGIPVIVPPIGGIAELVEEGCEGHKVDSRNIKELVDTITHIFNNSLLYQKMSENAKLRANCFSYEKMINGVEEVINEQNYYEKENRNSGYKWFTW